MTNKPDFPKVDTSQWPKEALGALKLAKIKLAKSVEEVDEPIPYEILETLPYPHCDLYEGYICHAISTTLDGTYPLTDDDTLLSQPLSQILRGSICASLPSYGASCASFETSAVAEWAEENNIDIQTLRHEWLDIIIKELEDDK